MTEKVSWVCGLCGKPGRPDQTTMLDMRTRYTTGRCLTHGARAPLVSKEEYAKMKP